MSRKPFELIVFDWDGTLMDSESHIVDCLRVSMRAVGSDKEDSSQLRQVIGLGLPEAIARLLPEVDEPTRLLAQQAFRDEFLAAGPGASRLFEGAEAVLESLRNEGYWLAVATGKSRRGLDKVMRDTQLEDMFAVTRCADETFSKPHPKMLEEILTDMDMPAKKALMVGDTEYDLQMAANINMPSLGVSYGVHAVERLQQQAPLGIVHSLPEVLDWVMG
ncbi:MAG: HAD-IA family hydrolase [bacterium]